MGRTVKVGGEPVRDSRKPNVVRCPFGPFSSNLIHPRSERPQKFGGTANVRHDDVHLIEPKLGHSAERYINGSEVVARPPHCDHGDMLFTADAWPGLADGSITLTFRTWTRPQANNGGRYRVAGMQLEAVDVRQVRADEIIDDDARRAGALDAASLLARMKISDPAMLVWRVELRYVGIDDRIDRREDSALDDAQLAQLRSKLDRLDRRGEGPWTRQTLRLIERYPGVVSTTLARHVGQERPAFKLNVRKLKELGLTESLDIGYRLSPRGEAVLRSVK